MYPYCIQRMQHLEPAYMCSRLELCRWINSNSNMIRNIFFTEPAHFTRDGVNSTRNYHLWDRDNPHGTVESIYQHLFAAKCGVVSLVRSVHFSATSDRWYLRQLFGRLSDSTVRECSSTNMTTGVLPAWRSAASFQSGRQSVSESNSQTNGLVVAVHRIGHHSQRIWTR